MLEFVDEYIPASNNKRYWLELILKTHELEVVEYNDSHENVMRLIFGEEPKANASIFNISPVPSHM